MRATTEVRAVGGMMSGFIEDPWGVSIELVEDPGAPGFHHIHLKSAGVRDTLSWYATIFGGERQKFMGGIDAIRYGSVWLMAEQGGPLPGRRAIDHLSWRVTNLDQTIAGLKAKKVKILTEPGPSPGGNRVAFVEDPAGVRIEIMQRRQ